MTFSEGTTIGAVVMFLICLWILVAAQGPRTPNACRAANPGYDCVLGWVRGEAFK